MDFNELSLTLTKQLSKDSKKNEGIYFTPKTLIKKIVDFVLEYKPESILEPSCGSGQFIEYLNEVNFIENVLGIESEGLEDDIELFFDKMYLDIECELESWD